YFDDSNSNYKYYVFDGINGNNRLTFDETKSYLNNTGRNSLLLERADEFHQGVDDLDPADYGVKTYNIVGCGVPTLGQIYILGKKSEEFSYNIHMINGDGTVPLRSAKAIPALKTYYVKKIQHALLPSVSGVRDLVVSILNNEDNFDISIYPNLIPDISNCSIPNGTIVSFHSPVELHVYDGAGNHTGPDVNGDIENNIEGLDYEVIDNNKFTFLPNNLDYKIVGKAIDQGVFDIRIQEVVNEEVSTTTMFTNIPVVSTTQAKFNINSSAPSQISIDNDGDGVFESEKNDPVVVVGFVEFLDTPSPALSSQVVSLGSSSSKKSVAVETAVESINVEETGIPIDEDLGTVKIKPNEVVVAITKEIVIEKKESIASSELVYKNTATVYYVIKTYLKTVFNGVWLWFKSKL
ncbi:hypothetical protein GW944_01045, partial [Candidatus Parcubacteria bacterium]|nr:hypothetical protein [Candidatus Parcubacteria bacterium]